MFGLGLGLGIGGPGNAATPLTVLSDVSFWTRGDVWTVSSFPDLSGKGNNFSQATGGNQPVINASDANFNGKPTATFNGTTTFLSASSFTKGVGTDFFIWAVIRCTGSATFGTIWSENVAAGDEFRIDQATTGPSMFSGYNAGVANWGVSIVNTTKATWGKDLAAGGGSGIAVDVSNGTPQVAVGSVHSGTDPTPIGLGARTTPSLFFQGQMAEIVVCNTMPSAAQLTSLQAYGVARYGAI